MNERAAILWSRLDGPGHEVAELVATRSGWRLSGIALLAHDGRPCRLEYVVACDRTWRTRRARIHGHLGDVAVALEITRDLDGEWRVNGAPMPSLRGCEDVDLGFSPATNLLPVRRLALAVGDRATVRAAWVRFPELTLEVLDQAYTRTADASYRYESGGGAFRRELTVNAAGFVVDYPGLWRAEAATGGASPAA